MRSARIRPPLLVLGVSLLLTMLATAVVAVTAQLRDEARFASATRAVAGGIDDRLETYVAMLHGVRALFAASDSVTRDEFNAYVARLETDDRYPGIQGIGFSRRVSAADTAAVMRELRRAVPEARIRPDTPRAEYNLIVLLEPLDRRNRAAMGYDMFTDSTRREAMSRARDTGGPVLSGRVRLVQEIDDGVQPGFLLYLPVYRGGSVPATVEERRAQLLGFVYSPFRAGDLFTGIFGRSAARLAFRVYDGPAPRVDRLLFDSRPGGAGPEPTRFVRADPLDIAGHRWTIAFASVPHDWVLKVLVPGIALTGIAVSFILFAITRSEWLARAAAERSERMRARFFASMSHELRTPINAILGYDDILLSGVWGELNERQRRGVERSQRAARHLTELVNDILDMSKLEAGKVELVPEEVHVVAIISDLFSTIGPMAASHGSSVSLEDGECDDRVVTDPRRLRQILLNLLSNAVRFGAGNPIVVRCASAGDGMLAIDVEDQGPGIPPAEQEHIFEEFVQLPNARARGGTGLGLPISRRLAALLGGRLEVRSELGRGSTFRLTIPRALPPRAAGGRPRAQ
ncbi:MAG TPA: CHASE domain-containing protein [Gemmatimonadaceae bacterium]|nr:CHASE domain-containing protein [Gemmatimonadaceae bacterium]